MNIVSIGDADMSASCRCCNAFPHPCHAAFHFDHKNAESLLAIVCVGKYDIAQRVAQTLLSAFGAIGLLIEKWTKTRLSTQLM